MSYVPNATASFSRETTYASSTRPFFIPSGDIVIDVSGNTVFPANVTIDGGLIVDDSIQTSQSLSVAGNITTSSGNITTETGFINQGDVAIGTNFINVDNIGNPNIQIDAKEGGDGQAYLDLITQKLTTTEGGNLHRVRSIVGNTGAYNVFHQTGAPGPLTTLQQMVWNAEGTGMEFAFGGNAALTMTKPVAGPNIVQAPGLVSVYGQNNAIAENALTTIFTLSAAQFGGFAAFTPITLKFFPGNLSVEYAVTYMMTISKLGGNLGVYIENQSIADAGLPAGWALTVAGGGTPTISINVTTGVTPIGTGGQFCNYAATFIGTGTV
jgi:hypothetical protein